MIALAAAVGLSTILAAAPANAPNHAWWACHHTAAPPHATCCSDADGHVLDADDWRPTSDPANPYDARVDGTWFPVPAATVIADNAECGPDPSSATADRAKIWYERVNGADGRLSLLVWCFIPGTMT